MLICARGWAQPITNSQAEPSDTSRVRLLAELAGKMGDDGTGDHGLGAVERGFALARKIRFSRHDALLYYTLGRVRRYRNEMPQSAEAFRTAIQISKQSGQFTLHQKARYGLAVCLTGQGNLPAAVRQIFDNLAEARRTGDVSAEICNLSLQALLYDKEGNTAAELACADRIEVLAKQVSNVEDLITGYSIRADVYHAQKQYKLAIGYRQRILDAVRPHKTLRVHLVSELNNLAQELRMAGRKNDVWPLLQEARQVGEQIQSTTSLAKTWSEYAFAYLTRANTKAARQAAQLGIQYARQSERPALLLDALDTQVAVNHQMGDDRAAFNALQQRTTLKDSLEAVAKDETIDRLRVQVAWQRDQDSLQQLRQRLTLTQLTAARREQDYQLQQQRQILFWTVIGSLCLLAAGALFSLIRARKTHRLLTVQNREIAEKSRQLNHLNAQKDRLFSIIGHDLRAPVTSLKQQLSQLQFLPASASGWQAKIGQLSRNADQLFNLTNNLLYWSLIQQNGLLSRSVNLSLMNVLNDALIQLDGPLNEKHLVIRYKNPDCQPIIRADEQQTAIVIRNILHNAIKFSPVGGEISVSVHSRAGQVHLLITDAGPGFAPAERAMPFGEHGTGLGLQLVADLMRVNNGTLQTSNAPDGGASVRLVWPLATGTRQRPVAPVLTQGVSGSASTGAA